jgi:hypothetical protein
LQRRHHGGAVELQEALIQSADHCVDDFREKRVRDELFASLERDARGLDVFEAGLLRVDPLVGRVGIRWRRVGFESRDKATGGTTRCLWSRSRSPSCQVILRHEKTPPG